jgi:hypothetical protein
VDPVQQLYLTYCGAMARRGAVRAPHEGPLDFTARVTLQLPELREKARNIGALYIALRYRGESDPATLDKFRSAVREFN